MRAIIYCYGDGHPMILGGENISDADRRAIVSHPMLRTATGDVLKALRDLRNNVERDLSGYWTESTANLMQQADEALANFHS